MARFSRRRQPHYATPPENRPVKYIATPPGPRSALSQRMRVIMVEDPEDPRPPDLTVDTIEITFNTDIDIPWQREIHPLPEQVQQDYMRMMLTWTRWRSPTRLSYYDHRGLLSRESSWPAGYIRRTTLNGDKYTRNTLNDIIIKVFITIEALEYEAEFIRSRLRQEDLGPPQSTEPKVFTKEYAEKAHIVSPSRHAFLQQTSSVSLREQYAARLDADTMHHIWRTATRRVLISMHDNEILRSRHITCFDIISLANEPNIASHIMRQLSARHAGRLHMNNLDVWEGDVLMRVYRNIDRIDLDQRAQTLE